MYDAVVGDEGPEMVVAATVFGGDERVFNAAETVAILSANGGD